ncbi:hypothetical protein OROGR_028105 [Orobanche gracilis]
MRGVQRQRLDDCSSSAVQHDLYLLIVPLCGDDEAPNKSVHFFPVGSEACVIARIEAYEFPLSFNFIPANRGLLCGSKFSNSLCAATLTTRFY